MTSEDTRWLIICGHDTIIDELKEENDRLRSTYDSMYSSMLDANQVLSRDLDTLIDVSKDEIVGLKDALTVANAELTVRKDDSRVLMRVVRWAQHLDMTPIMYRSGAVDVSGIFELLKDYLAVPVVSADTTIDENRVRNFTLRNENHRLRRCVKVMERELEELTVLYCAQSDQLEKIHNIIMEE